MAVEILKSHFGCRIRADRHDCNLRCNCPCLIFVRSFRKILSSDYILSGFRPNFLTGICLSGFSRFGLSQSTALFSARNFPCFKIFRREMAFTNQFAMYNLSLCRYKTRFGSFEKKIHCGVLWPSRFWLLRPISSYQSCDFQTTYQILCGHQLAHESKSNPSTLFTRSNLVCVPIFTKILFPSLIYVRALRRVLYLSLCNLVK